MRWKLCGNKSEWQRKKGDRTPEKGLEKLRHGNQQRRKRGMGTTEQRQKGHGWRQYKEKVKTAKEEGRFI